MRNLSLKNIYEWPLVTRSLIIGLICAVVFYLGYLFDMTHLVSELNNSKDKVTDLKEQIKFVIEKQNKVKQEVSQLAQSKAMLAQLQNQLVKYENIPQVLNEILKVGANNQLHFSSFSPEKDVSMNAYFKLPIHVIVVGSYHQLANFLSQVANMQWIVVISDFTISNDYKNDVIGSKLAEKAVAQNLLIADLKLEVYHHAQITKDI